MKRTIRIALSFCLILALLVGVMPASAENPPMTQGIYEKRFTAEGRGEYIAYIHFYENGVYYISLYNGGQYSAGYWELEDAEMEFFPNADEEDRTTTAMADKTLRMTNFDGSEYGVFGYDTATDQVVHVYTYFEFNFKHIADSTHSDEDETGVTVIEYVLPEDDFCAVSLKHNGTFEDSIDEIIEGTWTREDGVFVLTDSDSGKSYTISLNDDGTATYKGLNGTEIILANANAEKNAVLHFDGSLAEAAYGDMTGTVDCYEDGTALLTILYSGTTNEIPGTWKMADDYSNITFIFNDAEVVAPINYETQSFSFAYPCSDGMNNVELPFASAAKEQTAPVYTFVGENIPQVTCTLLSDGTCSLDFEGMGTVTSGTWSLDTASGPLPQFSITLEDTYENAGVTVETDYATKFFFTYTNGAGTLSETLALSFADFQAVQ